eukprot:GFYU01008156.1.p1 GENE.GFYU01008156.1~~GFYU01008156.1.p1  ORF type:complete len:690 (-),score=178.61 GFYU01008156.1:78-2147(-)
MGAQNESEAQNASDLHSSGLSDLVNTVVDNEIHAMTVEDSSARGIPGSSASSVQVPRPKMVLVNSEAIATQRHILEQQRTQETMQELMHDPMERLQHKSVEDYASPSPSVPASKHHMDRSALHQHHASPTKPARTATPATTSAAPAAVASDCGATASPSPWKTPAWFLKSQREKDTENAAADTSTTTTGTPPHGTASGVAHENSRRATSTRFDPVQSTVRVPSGVDSGRPTEADMEAMEAERKAKHVRLLKCKQLSEASLEILADFRAQTQQFMPQRSVNEIVEDVMECYHVCVQHFNPQLPDFVRSARYLCEQLKLEEFPLEMQWLWLSALVRLPQFQTMTPYDAETRINQLLPFLASSSVWENAAGCGLLLHLTNCLSAQSPEILSQVTIIVRNLSAVIKHTSQKVATKPQLSVCFMMAVTAVCSITAEWSRHLKHKSKSVDLKFVYESLNVFLTTAAKNSPPADNGRSHAAGVHVLWGCVWGLEQLTDTCCLSGTNGMGIFQMLTFTQRRELLDVWTNALSSAATQMSISTKAVQDWRAVDGDRSETPDVLFVKAESSLQKLMALMPMCLLETVFVNVVTPAGVNLGANDTQINVAGAKDRPVVKLTNVLEQIANCKTSTLCETAAVKLLRRLQSLRRDHGQNSGTQNIGSPAAKQDEDIVKSAQAASREYLVGGVRTTANVVRIR